MSAAKIAAFYDDPVKRAYDAWCNKKAFGLKSFSIDRGPLRTAERWAKFALQWLKGAVRQPKPASAVEAPALVPGQLPEGERAPQPARARDTVAL
jgi:hypothetical protein